MDSCGNGGAGTACRWVGVAIALAGGLGACGSVRATLSPGDIAVIGYQSDDPDTLGFVTLVPIGAGEVIRFTDDGWQVAGTIRQGEGGVQYTAPAPLPAGTVIVRGNPFTSGDWSVNSAGLG